MTAAEERDNLRLKYQLEIDCINSQVERLEAVKRDYIQRRVILIDDHNRKLHALKQAQIAEANAAKAPEDKPTPIRSPKKGKKK